MVNILGCHANEWALLNSVVVIVSIGLFHVAAILKSKERLWWASPTNMSSLDCSITGIA